MRNDGVFARDTAVLFGTACRIASCAPFRHGTSTDQIDRGCGVGARRDRRRACRRRDVAWRPGGACSPRLAAAAGTAAPLESSVAEHEREYPAGSPLTADTRFYLQRLSDVLRSRHLRWQPAHAVLSVSEFSIIL